MQIQDVIHGLSDLTSSFQGFGQQRRNTPTRAPKVGGLPLTLGLGIHGCVAHVLELELDPLQPLLRVEELGKQAAICY